MGMLILSNNLSGLSTEKIQVYILIILFLLAQCMIRMITYQKVKILNIRRLQIRSEAAASTMWY